MGDIIPQQHFPEEKDTEERGFETTIEGRGIQDSQDQIINNLNGVKICSRIYKLKKTAQVSWLSSRILLYFIQCLNNLKCINFPKMKRC